MSDQGAFDSRHKDFMPLPEAAEVVMERFKEPEVVEEPDNTAIAADRKRQLHNLYQDLREELKDAAANIEKPPTEALQNHIQGLF